MEPNSERNPPEQSRPPEPPGPKKRFRIRKLEERIAPKKGGHGTQNGCTLNSCSSIDTVLVCTLGSGCTL